MTQETFYWFDYETFGIDPALDRPSQFAGLRTTLDLQPIKDEEPLVIYNRLTDDYLPDPDAIHTLMQHYPDLRCEPLKLAAQGACLSKTGDTE